MKGPHISFVFIKKCVTFSLSFKYGSLIPAKRTKILKQITNETNRSVRVHTSSQLTALPAWGLIREGGGVPETCAVYCEFGLQACLPLASAINMPHSDMCMQPIPGSVNRFRIRRCPVHLMHTLTRLCDFGNGCSFRVHDVVCR